VESDLELGESLARPLSVSTMVVFANVVFLAGGVVIVASNPFGLQRERRLLLCGNTGDDDV
jgi:hypothetical protein